MAVVDRNANIKNRTELIAWLTEAAELEQLLMLQYLFAAHSPKKTPAEGITDAETELTRGWESLMLHVARQEMAHLTMVSILLLAIGGRPHFIRPNLPQPSVAYRPFPFTLQRFGDENLTRFIRAEQPQPAGAPLGLDLVPNPPDYGYNGELYRKISAGFATVEADLAARGETLFIGPIAGQAKGNWSTSISIQQVKDLATAQAAIEEIVVEGEGATADSPNSHWSIFKGIEKGLLTASATNQTFEPARNVADNPMMIDYLDASGAVNLIEYEPSRQLAGLFNTAYGTILYLLMQFFDFAGETPEEPNYLQAAFSQTMSAIILPVAEVLTQMPLRSVDDDLRAGRGFEFYAAAFDVSTQMEYRWTPLHERMRFEAEGARRSRAKPGYQHRWATSPRASRCVCAISKCFSRPGQSRTSHSARSKRT